MKNCDIFLFFAKKQNVGTRKNRLNLNEVVLTSTHNLCFRAKIRKITPQFVGCKGYETHGSVILMSLCL